MVFGRKKGKSRESEEESSRPTKEQLEGLKQAGIGEELPNYKKLDNPNELQYQPPIPQQPQRLPEQEDPLGIKQDPQESALYSPQIPPPMQPRHEEPQPRPYQPQPRQPIQQQIQQPQPVKTEKPEEDPVKIFNRIMDKIESNLFEVQYLLKTAKQLVKEE